MDRRSFIKAASGAACSSMAIPPNAGALPNCRKPNVLFLFSDQHNANATGYSGNPDASTPSLDRLCAQGTRFDRAYCNDAICMPSRNSMMTGVYPRQLGIYDNVQFEASILERRLPLQKVFKTQGYYTFTAGKRHLLTKVDTDWDYSAGLH
jgi:arylsulfatase A-like enzyme